MLMLGTFPPAPKRWCMPFYYPNYQNDMWRIFGICFFGDKTHFLLEEEKRFNLGLIKPFLIEKGIAMYDTAVKVNRTKNTASDKDLQILQPTDLDDMLNRLPCCKAVITAGERGTDVFCRPTAIRKTSLRASTSPGSAIPRRSAITRSSTSTAGAYGYTACPVHRGPIP